MNRSSVNKRQAAWALWVSLLITWACVEIKDDDGKDATGSPQTAPAAALTLDELTVPVEGVSVPSYELSSADTTGVGSRFAAEVGVPDHVPSDSATSPSEKANAPLARFPARIPKSGPTPLHIQILLDRVHFSPGIIDGAWGDNAARALAFFAKPDATERLTGGMPATISSIDRATYERLRAVAGQPPLLVRYTLTSADVTGPFTDIPELVYDQAKLKCLCYSSGAEAIAERFHTSRKLLAQLNPKANFDKLTAGTKLLVPNVASENVASAMDTVIVAKLIISRTGFWTHAVNADGTILAHYPSTLGAGYDPSPTGQFKVTYVSRDPAFHYQPKLFAEVPDDKPEARLPPGPNSPVGRVWMSLSKPHYGIHGTSSPETIGYANSHGCVRLTNWDALQLSDLVESGTPVEFH